jgi:peroxiredoxin Q/BCP
MLTPGSKAPNFTLQDHRGQKVSLSELKGKTVVLWFFPKADTPGCTRQGCGFRDHSPKFAAEDAVILGVSFDDVAANRAFAEKFQFPFQLLCDVDKKVSLSYGAATSAADEYPKRITYVIGKDGIVREAIETKDPGGQAASLLERL